jgi:hypothetical protein
VFPAAPLPRSGGIPSSPVIGITWGDAGAGPRNRNFRKNARRQPNVSGGPQHSSQRIAQQAIIEHLQDRRFVVHAIDNDTMSASEMISIFSLFRSVNRSIQLHTIGPQVFPAKKTAFEYNLGPVADILKANGADGLVLALGHQTGTDRPARNWISIAVVEPEGRIIWYGIHGDHERFNMQTAEGINALVASTMANFWEQGS